MKIPIVNWGARKASQALDFSKLDVAALRRGRDAAFARARDHSPPITRVCPVSRAIPLGGGHRTASELRIADLAQLQAWLEEQVPHPLASIPPAWADSEPESRLERLAAAWEAAASWPVRYGTERAAELLGTIPGRAFFLWLCLRRDDPTFGVVDALALLHEITHAEWAGLLRVAYGRTPRQEIADELAPDETPGRMSNWCVSFHRAVMSDAGITYANIGELTISQWRNFCMEGKQAEQSAEFAAQARRVREILGGS
jgi:hypothetical protein